MLRGVCVCVPNIDLLLVLNAEVLRFVPLFFV